MSPAPNEEPGRDGHRQRITVIDAGSRRARTLRGLATGIRASPGRAELLATRHRRIEPLCDLCPPYSDEPPLVESLADGTSRRLARRLSIDASWSPDGRFVALVLVTGETSFERGLFVVRRDGSGLRRLVPPPR